jgi:UDP-N-acetylmuramoylalanine--D-glutamate ligase
MYLISISMILNELKNKNNIAILWFWIEGKSTLRFLLDLWIKISNITIIDQNNIDIEFKWIIITWELYLNNLSIYDVIIKSPWISPYNEKILPFRSILTSQTEIFFNNYIGKTIWITGTKGKSTVSTLLYETLKKSELSIKLVGNIGNPVLEDINLTTQSNYDYIIYELSSYMLETCKPKCDIAILWNIYTCHLDWHNNQFCVYEQAKLNILKKSNNKIISQEFSNYGQGIDNVKYFWLGSEYHFSNNTFYKNDIKLFKIENLLLLWDHNKKNICSVISVLDIISEQYEKQSDNQFDNIISSLKKTLLTFSWLPHRMEIIWEFNNITFIDDGISTTPESTIEAIKTFWNKINTLFLWGWDYGFTKDSYKLLINSIIKYNIKNIVLFPDTGLDIFDIWRNKKQYGDIFSLGIKNIKLNILFTNKMSNAVKFSYKFTWVNNICLMSCAAPSYSLWTWYIQKWSQFKEYIEKNKKENM